MSAYLNGQFADLLHGLTTSGPPYMPMQPSAADKLALAKHLVRFALLADGYIKTLAEAIYEGPLEHVRHGEQWRHPVTEALNDLIADARARATCPVEPEDDEHDRAAA